MSWGLFYFWVILFISQVGQATVRCEFVFKTPVHLLSTTSIDSRAVKHLLKINPTDRYTVFAKHAQKSVPEFVDHVLTLQQRQVDLFKQYPLRDVPDWIYHSYLGLLEAALKNSHSDIKKIKLWEQVDAVRMEDLIMPEPALMPLRDSMVSLMIKTNSIFAELLAAIEFPQVMATEKTISYLIREVPPDRLASFRQKMGESDWGHFLTKKMDLVGHEGDSLLWVEVKYLGRDKIYTSVSGEAVFKKLSDVKALTQLIDRKIRIMLVTVGPGKLSGEVMDHYQKNGIEVRSLTPEW